MPRSRFRLGVLYNKSRMLVLYTTLLQLYSRYTVLHGADDIILKVYLNDALALSTSHSASDMPATVLLAFKKDFATMHEPWAHRATIHLHGKT